MELAQKNSWQAQLFVRSVAPIGKIYVNKMQGAKKGSQYKSNQQTDGGKKVTTSKLGESNKWHWP